MPAMQQSLGESAEWSLGPLKSADGTNATGFDGSETWTWEIWPGDDQAVLATGDGTLRTVDEGEATEESYVDISILKADLADLSPGLYRTVCLKNPGVDDTLVYDETIKLTSAPGSATALLTTCSRNDLISRQSWVEDLQDQAEWQAGFAEQRAEARLWRHSQLMSRIESVLEGQSGLHGAIAYIDPIIPTSGVDAGPGWGNSTIPDTTLMADLATFQGYLDDDMVMVGTIDNGSARNIDAWYALHLIAESQAAGTDDSKPWQAWSERCRSKAIRACACWTAFIDTDDDGVPNFRIRP